MSKTFKYKTEDLIELIHEYIATKGACKIVIQRLVEFARQNPLFHDINYQHFTRNPQVKTFIENYNNSLEAKLMDLGKANYLTDEKYFDARDFYGKGQTEINEIVSDFNHILERIYNSQHRIVIINKKLGKEAKEAKKTISCLNDQINDLKLERAKLKTEIDKLNNKVVIEHDKNIQLAKFVDEQIVNPNLVLKLQKNGLLHSNSDDILLKSKLLGRSLEEIVNDSANPENSSVISANEFEFIEKLEKLYDYGDEDEI